MRCENIFNKKLRREKPHNEADQGDTLKHPNIYTSLQALQKLKHRTQGINLQANQPINSLLNGRHVSKLRGRGLNFEEMRQYSAGDDIRTMDWRVTMRTGRPHVKVFNEERERNVYVVVDQRQSMFFGSQYKLKSVIAAEIAALVSWGSVASTDKIGAVIFNDEQCRLFQPKRSKRQVTQILDEIVDQNQQLKSGSRSRCFHSSINKAFETVSRVAGHDALVVFVSDGRGWDEKTTQYVKRLRQHNEFIFCHVVDPLERELPNIEATVISDGLMQLEVDMQTLASQYQKKIEERFDYLRSISQKYRIPVLPIDTLSDSDVQLRPLLGSRNHIF